MSEYIDPKEYRIDMAKKLYLENHSMPGVETEILDINVFNAGDVILAKAIVPGFGDRYYQHTVMRGSRERKAPLVFEEGEICEVIEASTTAYLKLIENYAIESKSTAGPEPHMPCITTFPDGLEIKAIEIDRYGDESHRQVGLFTAMMGRSTAIKNKINSEVARKHHKLSSLPWEIVDLDRVGYQAIAGKLVINAFSSATNNGSRSITLNGMDEVLNYLIDNRRSIWDY